MNKADQLIDMVGRCKDGDMSAMETVYTLYKSSLYNLAYRYCGNPSSAEDLLQDIFIRIFTNISQLRSPEAFQGWLYRIAVNTCLSFSRREKKVRHIPIAEIEDMPLVGHSDTSKNLYLKQAISTLPPKQKMVFILHDIQGFTHVEIAEYMKLNRGTCKSQLFKARMKLRECLGAQSQ